MKQKLMNVQWSEFRKKERNENSRNKSSTVLSDYELFVLSLDHVFLVLVSINSQIIIANVIRNMVARIVQLNWSVVIVNQHVKITVHASLTSLAKPNTDLIALVLVDFMELLVRRLAYFFNHLLVSQPIFTPCCTMIFYVYRLQLCLWMEKHTSL